MCTTSQILFVCLHQATHRFRTGVCRQANRGGCKIYDATEILSFPCMDCAAIVDNKRCKCGDGRGRPSFQQVLLPNRLLHTTWHVPSRCFVDVGFQTLDPFSVRDDQEILAGTIRRSQRAESSPAGMHMELVANRSPVLTDKCGRWRVSTGNQNWQLNSCCLRKTREGAYQAARLEGRGERINGRIMDSFCESSL
jgi:hypothetical protein